VQPARVVGRVKVDRDAPAFPTVTALAAAVAPAPATLVYAARDARGRRAYAWYQLPSSDVPPRYRL